MRAEETEEKLAQAPPQSPKKETHSTEMEKESMTITNEQQKKKEKEAKEEEKAKEEEITKEHEKKITPKATTSVDMKTSTQNMPAAKRQLETFQVAAEPSVKSKKARVSASIKSPGTMAKKGIKKASIKTGEFSFARPTASSASRTAAVVKATPTPPPARKPSHPKKSPAPAQRSSMPAPKTPVIANKASRSNFSYTPYTGPLPPLTVQSSFAPKGSQSLGHETRTASPAGAKKSQKPRSASAKKAQSGKENSRVIAGEVAATNAASSSKAKQALIRASDTMSTVETRSEIKENAKAVQLAVRSTLVTSAAAVVESAT